MTLTNHAYTQHSPNKVLVSYLGTSHYAVKDILNYKSAQDILLKGYFEYRTQIFEIVHVLHFSVKYPDRLTIVTKPLKQMQPQRMIK